MNRERNAALSQAIRAGDVATVQRVLAEDPSVVSVDWGRGRTWLHKAAEFSSVEVVAALVGGGIGVNAQLDGGAQTPLHLAVLRDRVAVADWLISHGADVNIGGGAYPTPLSFAASGSLEMVELLVRNGARVNTCHDSPPKNPLLLACEHSRLEIEQFLRSKGAVLPEEMSDGTRGTMRRGEVLAHLQKALGSLRLIRGGGEQIEVWVSAASEPPEPVTAVTVGISEHVMRVDGPSRIELLFELPSGWPLSGHQVSEGFAWPFDWLERLGEYVVTGEAEVGAGHTFASSTPSEPLGPGTRMSAMLLLRELRDFGSLRCSDGSTVELLSVFPIHSAELALKEEQGVAALLTAFQSAGVSTQFDPGRPSVVT